MSSTVPAIDYSSRDYTSLRASLLAYAAQAFPEWTPSSEGDFGVLMVELLAYMGDVLSYYVDRAQYEAYLPTATQLQSVLNIAQMLGYQPGAGAPATAQITFTLAAGLSSTIVPAGTQVATDYIDALDGPVIFETTADFTLSPTSTTAASATVTVTEGQTQARPDGTPIVLASSNGLPDQTYRLPVPNVYQSSISVYVNGVLWNQVTHLVDAAATDNSYSITLDANGYTWINFGDGLNGAAPSVGLPISVIYRVGFGASGNVVTGAITSLYNNSVPGLTISPNTSPATGGADPETIDQIRANAPKAFASQNRAVTLQDFINTALAIPGVSKANAISSYWTSIILYILGPGGGAPTSSFVTSVQRQISRLALAGVNVQVNAATQVTIEMISGSTGVSVTTDSLHSNAAVARDVLQAMQDYFNGLEIGANITVADLYYKIMGVAGVRYVSIPLLARADGSLTGTGPIQLAASEYAVLDVSNTSLVTVTGGM